MRKIFCLKSIIYQWNNNNNNNNNKKWVVLILKCKYNFSKIWTDDIWIMDGHLCEKKEGKLKKKKKIKKRTGLWYQKLNWSFFGLFCFVFCYCWLFRKKKYILKTRMNILGQILGFVFFYIYFWKVFSGFLTYL
jgi:hypothetical protein